MEYPSETIRQFCRLLSFDAKDQEGLSGASIGDWQPILQLALQQQLAPLLYQRIYSLKLAAAVPAGVIAALRNLYYQSAARGMRLVQQFDAIQAGMDAAHIPVIPLKGIYLAQVVYSNQALRSMSDIDILIQTKDTAEVVAVLSSLGYQPARQFDIRREFKFHRHLPAFIKPGSCSIEIHNTLQEPGDPFNIDLAGLWGRAGETRVDNRAIINLDPHDLLLYLCINLAFHDLFRLGLKGLYDLGAVIEHFKTGLDWDELYSRSIEWKAGRLVYTTLFLARNLLDANVPVEFLTRLTPPHFDESVFSICTGFIFSSPSGEAPMVTPELNRWMKTTSLVEKSRILLNRLFISRWEMACYYKLPPSSWRIYFYYPLRLFYLTMQYKNILYRPWRGNDHLEELSQKIEDQDNQRKVLLDYFVSQ